MLKMPVQVETIYSISDVSRICEINRNTLAWRLRTGKLERPEVLYGKRKYYSETQLQRIRERLESVEPAPEKT